jgi:two-component system, NtrC family, response regulator AtoC
MKSFKIFIVEDDPFYGEVLKYHLSLNADYEVILYDKAMSCLDQLNQQPHAICIDFNLPDMPGIDLLKRIHEYNSEIPVIVISGQDDVSTALGLLKQGAYDYLVKDEHTKEHLWNNILKIRANSTLKNRVEQLQDQLETTYQFEKTIIGQSKALKSTFKLIAKAIQTNINVSITGETGTGKEVVAKAIHFNSARRKKPFIAVNMAAIPKDLIESELFGHEKGSFTGASTKKIGKFQEAHNGSIFLDEIAELDLSLQSKLLRVLQEREVVPLGSNSPIKFNARLIIATHKNLADEVKAGRFREDLFFRIMGLPIELPPLRKREKDVLILAKHFASNFAKQNQKNNKTFTEKAKEKLLKYTFPGNIRELKSTIELAFVLSDNHEISENDLSFNAATKNVLFKVENEKSLRDYTIDIITLYLQKYNNNVVQVAQKLKIGKSSIYNMLKTKELKI